MRIGINIPNELLARVKAIRPEVNVSQICREALEERVRNAERVKEQIAADGIVEHALRLAEVDEHLLIEPDWVGFALEDARDCVRNITRKEWDFFCYQRDVLKRQGRGDENWHAEDPPGKSGKGFWKRRSENAEWFIAKYERDLDSTAVARARDEYCRTWMAYMEEVRRKLELYVAEEHKKLQEEREKESLTRRTPELPPQLLDHYKLE